MPNPIPEPEVKLLPPGHKKSLWWLYLLLALVILVGLFLFLRGCKPAPTTPAEELTAHYGSLEQLPTIELPADIHFSQRFAMSDGRILFYGVYNHAKDGEINPVTGRYERYGPTQAFLFTYDSKTNTWEKLDHVAISNSYLSQALLLQNGKLLVVGADGKCKECENFYSKLYPVLYDLKTGEATPATMPEDKTWPIRADELAFLGQGAQDTMFIHNQPFLVEVSGKGVIISTYLSIQRQGAHPRNIEFLYDLQANTVSPRQELAGLPQEAQPKVLLPDQRVLFATQGSFYIFDPKTTTTTFLRKLPSGLAFKGMQGLPDSTLIVLRDHTAYHPGDPFYLYDYKTNQIYSNRFPELDLKLGHFEDIKFGDNNIPRDVEGEDREFKTQDRVRGLALTPLSDGTLLVTSPYQYEIINANIGIMRLLDLKFLKPLNPQPPKEINPGIEGAVEDTILLADGRVLLLNRSRNLTGLVYTPAKQATTAQQIAKSWSKNYPALATTNFATNGIWQISKGKLHLYSKDLRDEEEKEDQNRIDADLTQNSVDTGSAYPLKDGRILFVQPQGRLVNKTKTDRELIGNGVFGQIYNPETGTSKLLKYSHLEGKSFPYAGGKVLTNGLVQFGPTTNNQTLIFNPKTLTVVLRKSKKSDANRPIFSYSVDPGTPTHKLSEPLPWQAGKGIKIDGKEVQVISLRSGKAKKLVELPEKHVASKMFLDSKGRLIVVSGVGETVGRVTNILGNRSTGGTAFRSEGFAILRINLRSKKIEDLTKGKLLDSAPTRILPGDKLLLEKRSSRDINSISIYDPETNSFLISSQPLVAEGELIQNAKGSLFIVDSAKTPPNPINVSNGAAPYLYADLAGGQYIDTDRLGSKTWTNWKAAIEPGQVQQLLLAGDYGYTPKLYDNISWLAAFLLLQILQALVGAGVIFSLYKTRKTS